MQSSNLQEALHALYHHPDAAVKAEANAWLQQWQQSPAAWEAAPAVLRAPDAGLEAQYFAAQTLRAKAQRDCGQLMPGGLHALCECVVPLLSRFASGPALVRAQLCLAAAALAARDAGLAPTLAAWALATLPAAPALALELLASLAEEAGDAVTRRGPAPLQQALAQSAEVVLSAVGASLQQSLQRGEQSQSHPAPASLPVAAAALGCAEAWLRSPPPPGGAWRGWTPGELHHWHPQLLSALIAALTTEPSADGVAAAAAQALVALFSGGTLRGGGDPSAQESHDAAAYRLLFARLAALRPRIGAAPAAVALGVAQVASAAAEHWPEAAAGAGGVAEAPRLAELMLGCLARREGGVAEAALDYFLMVNTVPLAERPPQLQAPLFAAALDALAPHAAYPPGFTAWGDCGAGHDPDDFERMRGAVLPEALEVTYCLLRWRYLELAWRRLGGAASWQAAEAALYLLTSVALPVKARALLRPGSIADAEVGEDVRRSNALLQATFAQLYAPPAAAAALASHPALARALCTLLERYAPWLAQQPGAPVQEALQCLLLALRVPGVEPAAAAAFQAVCVRCTHRLGEPGAVRALTEAVHEAVPLGAALALDDKRALVEGLARLAAALPSDSAAAAAEALTQPFVAQALAALAGAGGGSGEPPRLARQAVAQTLWLLAASLRFLLPLSDGGGGGGGGPAAGVLRSTAGLLGEVSRSPEWARDEQVGLAVAEAYKQVACSSRREGAKLLPAVVPDVSALFEATALPAYLDVLSEALEVHAHDPGAAALLLGALRGACAAALPALLHLTPEGLRERGDLAAALLSLADAFAIYSPAPLWASPALPPLLDLAAAAAALREAAPSQAALGLLGRVLSAHERAGGGGAAAAHEAVAARGGALAGALLRALCDTLPRQHMRAAADCLRAMLAHPALSERAKAWVVAACGSGLGAGAGGGAPPLCEEDCRRVCALATDGLRGPRLVALLVDFGLVARGQNTRDVLLAYEL